MAAVADDNDGPGVSFRRGFAIDPLNFSLLPSCSLFHCSSSSISASTPFSAVLRCTLLSPPPGFPAFLPRNANSPRETQQFPVLDDE